VSAALVIQSAKRMPLVILLSMACPALPYFFTLSHVYLLYYVCIVFFFTLDAGLLARSQYLEDPATGHLDTRFSWFPCA